MLMKQDLKHWSSYWQGGQLTSLPQDFEENYEGELLKLWHNCFRSLKRNDRVLDVCTGNCAIALLVSDYVRLKEFNVKITAVDIAKISKSAILNKYPHQKENISKINIVSNCKVENIGFEDGSFDLITSQYGIEYTDWNISANQVYRLLKEDGEFTMICHSGSTEILKYMLIEQNNYDILQSLNYFKNIVNFFSKRISYLRFKSNLDNIYSKIIQEYNKNKTELLYSVLQMIERIRSDNKRGLIHNKQNLINYCKHHKYASLRMHDLLNVTSSINKYPDWYKCFSDAGLTLIKKQEVIQRNAFNSGILYTYKKMSR